MSHQSDQIVTGFTTADRPRLLKSSTGRYHCAFYYDDGGGNTGIYHAYLDTWTTGWVVNTDIATNAPSGPSAVCKAALLQEDSTGANPNRIHCFWGLANASNQIYSAYSDDDGITWSAPALFYNYTSGTSFQVSVIVTDTGRWLFAVSFNTTNGKIITFYTDDAGATFSDPIIHRFTNCPGGIFDMEQLPGGKVVIATKNTVSFGMDMIYSVDRGDNWRTQVIIDSPLRADPDIIQIDNDLIMCAHGGSPAGSVEVSSSSNDGYTWGTPVVINAANSEDPSIVQLNNGVLICAYVVYAGPLSAIELKASNDRGVTWTLYGTITIAAVGEDGRAPCLYYDEDADEVFCAYATVGPDDVRLRKSSDGGQTWGTHVVIRAESGAYFPSMDVDSNGNFICVFQAGTTPTLAIKHCASPDGGVTWSAPVTVTLPYEGRRPQIAMLSDGLHLVVALKNGSSYYITDYVSYDDAVSWHNNGRLVTSSAGRSTCIYQTLNGHVIVGWSDPGGFVYAEHSGYTTKWDNPNYRPSAVSNLPDTPVITAWMNHTNLLVQPDGLLYYYSIDFSQSYIVVTAAYDESFTEWTPLAATWHGSSIDYRAYYDLIMGGAGILLAKTNYPVNGNLETFYAEPDVNNSDPELATSLDSYTGLEAPQIVVTWDSAPEVVADGTAATITVGTTILTKAGETFTDTVVPGDRIILTRPTPSVLGTFDVVDVISDTQLEFLQPTPWGGTYNDVIYEVVRGLPYQLELVRKEYEYPEKMGDGNTIIDVTNPDPTFDTFYGDAGESTLIRSDGATNVGTLNRFDSPAGLLPTYVNVGDTLIIRDSADIRNNGFYTITGVSASYVLVSQDLPLAGISGLTFEIWHGPFPLRTYYYSLFSLKRRNESLQGLTIQKDETWCFAGGTDMDPDTPTFKTKLWKMMPKAYRDYDAHKLASTVNEIIANGELIYRDDSTFIAGHLERLARMFGLLIQRGSDLVENFQAAWTPESATPPVLEELMTLIGAEVNRIIRLLPVSKQRKFLKMFIAAVQKKGTEESLIRIAKFYGYDLELDVPFVRGHLDTCQLLQAGGGGSIISSDYFECYRNAGVDGACYGATDPDLFESLTGAFITNGVQIGDTVTITGGTNAGTYAVKQLISEIQLLVTPDFPAGDTTLDTWDVDADIADVSAGDLLKIKDPAQEDNNGNWVIQNTNKFGHDIEVALNWTVAPQTGIRWEIWSGYYFDLGAFLDSYSLNWKFDVRMRLYKDGVYQLWELEDTQLVYNELLKFSPHNINLVYNQEVP